MARPIKEKVLNICEYCQKEFYTRPSEIRKYCSHGCSQKIKGINKEWLNKRDKTNLEKYGNKVSFKSEQVQKKYKQNMMEKYGVENPFLVSEFRNRATNTIKERYGNNVANKSPEISSKISKALKGKEKSRNFSINRKWEQLINYSNITGMTPLFDKKHLEKHKLNHIFENKFQFKCNKCGSITEISLANNYLPSCNCSWYGGKSSIENDIIIFLKQYIDEKDIYLNRRDILLNRNEIDIYIPSYNLAIEINGIYWHSELNGKNSKYHLNKTTQCLDKGINLIHIMDIEWIMKQNIIKSIILNKINKVPDKIYARKCIIKPITDTKITSEFLNGNHIQGYTHASVNIGLYYEEQLISLMTFGKNRFKKDANEWEMIRFCNILNTNVIGGASKLFKYFNNNYNTNNIPIISYSDRRFFSGKLYEILNFKFGNYTKPSYIYWKNNKILHRMTCQKHKLPKLLEEFDSNLSEYENMIKNGWNRIWDCGNTKWIYNKFTK